MKRTQELEGFFDWEPEEQERIVQDVADSFLKQVMKFKTSLDVAKEHLQRLTDNAIDNEDYEVAEVFKRIIVTIDNAMEYENALREKNSVNVNLNRNPNI